MKYDIALELGRIPIDFSARENALRIKCPFHDDATPSCDVFFEDGGFKCHACNAHGGLVQLLAKLTDRPQHIVKAEIEARYGTDEKAIDAEQVERYHRQLHGHKVLIAELTKRAINEHTIRKYRLGRDGERITIPIPDPSGQWVNVRRYAPGATEGSKMTSMKGRGKRLRLYPFNQLRFKKLVLCGGEVKALATAQALNQYDIGAITLSGGGEQDWSVPLESFFTGKTIYVCNDIDRVGVEASKVRCSRLLPIAEWVGMVELPLDIDKYPHGGIDDYIAEAGADALLALINSTLEFSANFRDQVAGVDASSDATDAQEPTEIQVADINTAKFVGKRIQVKVRVNAINENIYYVPKKLTVTCSRDQDFCAICPVFMSRTGEFEIPAESPSILAIMESRKNTMREELLEAIRIPNRCPVAVCNTLENYKVVETRVQKSLELSDHTSDKHVLPAVIVDDDVDANETYEMIGKPVPHPKTQAAFIIVSKTKPVADALDTFQLGDTEDLKIFQPKSWTHESILETLDPIYSYYENNVTKIYDRTIMHRIVDLVFHSVLSINVKGQSVKGWLELLVIGDSSQGKSETLDRLIEYLNLGFSVDCANATTAGLLGGLENMGGKWFAQWGVLPTHDRRLVKLEELKELPHDVFRKLTNTRSSGRAEIPKIRKSWAPARTRLVALTNPFGGQQMAAYSYGVTAIKDIILKPEDIRRFDAAVVLNKDDIRREIVNQPREPQDEFFPREAARRLVLWAWTRLEKQVILEKDTFQLCLDTAQKLGDIFSDTIPLLDRGSTRWKLLRFAAAAACRTFSSDEHGNVIVRPCHVEYITDLLRREYESPSNGYLEFSKHDNQARWVLDEKMMNTELNRAPYPQLLAQRMLSHHDIDLQDFCDWCGWTRDEAAIFISTMVRCNAIMRGERSTYRKTPPAVDALKNFSLNGSPLGAVPDHIEKDKGKY